VGLADGEPRGAVWRYAAACGCLLRKGNDAATKALLVAKVDVHAKNKVRVGEEGGCWDGKWGAAFGRAVTVLVWRNDPELVDRPNP